MNPDTQRDRLVQRLEALEPDQLSSVIDFMDFLLQQQSHRRSQPETGEEQMALGERFRQLFKETQALHADNPLTDEEIAAEVEAYRRGE
jgi:hypothetical protein